MQEPQRVEWTTGRFHAFCVLDIIDVSIFVNRKSKEHYMNDSALHLKRNDEFYQLDLSLTLYFMADDHYTYVLYTTGANFMIPFGLGSIEELLTSLKKESFKRLGRKYIVNLDVVHSISTSKQQLSLFTNTGKLVTLRLAKPVLRELMDSLSDSV